MTISDGIAAGMSLGLFLLSPVSAVFAAEIHKWVDQDGITHYSEILPADDEIITEKLELPDSYSTEPQASEDGYYSVFNQASRLEASRLAREEERRKDRQQDLQELALEAQQTPEVVDTRQDDRYYPVFFQNNRVRQYDNSYNFQSPNGRERDFDGDYNGGKSHQPRPGNTNPRNSPAFDSSLFEKQ